MGNHCYQPVVSEISDRVRELSGSKQCILIGIDGYGGSGKSTFAAELSESLEAAPIISIDDFYKPSRERKREPAPHAFGWQFDWQRLEKEVLKPLNTKGSARYRRYDWKTDGLANMRTMQAGSPIIIEGVYILRPELVSYYDLRLWIECPKEIRLQRGIVRDGEQARSQWEDDWMKEEERYVHACSPHLHAERIIQGMPLG
jgi:uridine kinase